MEPGDLCWIIVLNSALPPQRHRPDTRLEHEDLVSHMAQKKRERKRKKEKKKIKKLLKVKKLKSNKKERKKRAAKPKNKSTNDRKR